MVDRPDGDAHEVPEVFETGDIPHHGYRAGEAAGAPLLRRACSRTPRPDQGDATTPRDGEARGRLIKTASNLREPTSADQQVCPLCQITWLDFRNTGRLGCPHDYEVFRDDLLPLIENIHDETRHAGKVPRRAPQGTQRQAEMIQLRNELKRAVAAEDYEAAARIRDRIKGLDQPL